MMVAEPHHRVKPSFSLSTISASVTRVPACWPEVNLGRICAMAALGGLHEQQPLPRPRLQQQLPELRMRNFIRNQYLALIGHRFCGPTLAQISRFGKQIIQLFS